MARYIFKTELVGSGATAQSAWEDAVEALAEHPGDVDEVTDGWTLEPDEEEAEEDNTLAEEKAAWLQEAFSLLPQNTILNGELRFQLEQAFDQGKTNPQEAVNALFH